MVSRSRNTILESNDMYNLLHYMNDVGETKINIAHELQQTKYTTKIHRHLQGLSTLLSIFDKLH